MQTIKQWILNCEATEIDDITKHGMSAGFAGLIYYSDTGAWYDKFEDSIWEMLYEDAQSMGMTILELIASFGGAKDVGSNHEFKNLLCWYAVERTANEIINELEEVEND